MSPGRRRREAERAQLALTALVTAEKRGLTSSLADLVAVDSLPRRWALLRTVRLMERVGLLARGPSEIHGTGAHIWSRRPLTLTAAGRAAAMRAQKSPPISV